MGHFKLGEKNLSFVKWVSSTGVGKFPQCLHVVVHSKSIHGVTDCCSCSAPAMIPLTSRMCSLTGKLGVYTVCIT